MAHFDTKGNSSRKSGFVLLFGAHRVRTGPVNPGKSWNFTVAFPVLESFVKSVKFK